MEARDTEAQGLPVLETFANGSRDITEPYLARLLSLQGAQSEIDIAGASRRRLWSAVISLGMGIRRGIGASFFSGQCVWDCSSCA